MRFSLLEIPSRNAVLLDGGDRRVVAPQPGDDLGRFTSAVGQRLRFISTTVPAARHERGSATARWGETTEWAETNAAHRSAGETEAGEGLRDRLDALAEGTGRFARGWTTVKGGRG